MDSQSQHQFELNALRAIAAKRDLSPSGQREYLAQLQRVANAYALMQLHELRAMGAGVVTTCVACGWQSPPYPTRGRANYALLRHQQRCTKAAQG
jgi:hypothetical protein